MCGRYDSYIVLAFHPADNRCSIAHRFKYYQCVLAFISHIAMTVMELLFVTIMPRPWCTVIAILKKIRLL